MRSCKRNRNIIMKDCLQIFQLEYFIIITLPFLQEQKYWNNYGNITKVITNLESLLKSVLKITKLKFLFTFFFFTNSFSVGSVWSVSQTSRSVRYAPTTRTFTSPLPCVCTNTAVTSIWTSSWINLMGFFPGIVPSWASAITKAAAFNLHLHS